VLADDNPGILAFFNDGLDRFEKWMRSPTVWDRGLTRTVAVPATRNLRLAGPASPSILNSPSPVVQSHPKTQRHSSSRPMVPPVKLASRSSSFQWHGQHERAQWGVEDLFTVSGRSDAGACSLTQPSFNAARSANNIIFRIPTPTFGAGLIENLDDSTLLNNQAKNLNNISGFPEPST